MKRSRVSQAVALANFLITLTILATVAAGQGSPGQRGRSSTPIEAKAAASECPGEVGVGLCPDILQPNDFVELQCTSCFGACPVYTVRIRADGNVSWKGNRGVMVMGPVTASVSPTDARR